MTKPLGYYIDPAGAIAAIAEIYGDQLQRMTTADKLLIIQILAGALRDCEIHPGTPVKITWLASDQPSDPLKQCLFGLSGSKQKTLLSLMESIIAQLRYPQFELFAPGQVH